MPRKRAAKKPGKFLNLALLLIAAIIVVELLLLFPHPEPAKGELPPPDLGDFCGTSTYAECDSDVDCIRGGCSGEICQSAHQEPVITPCWWRDCFDTDKHKTFCLCMNHKCQWWK